METLSRILAAAGFDLRMRLAQPDLHDATRLKAEALLPADQFAAFIKSEQERVKRARRKERATVRG